MVNEPVPVISKEFRSVLRNARLDRKHQLAIRNFPNKNFTDVKLTNNQKKRLRHALESLMILRSYRIRLKMPFSQNGVHIMQHHATKQGELARFDIFVDGIRLTEPISRNFYPPFLKYVVTDQNMVVGIDPNMSKAGWRRTYFEPVNI